MSKKTYNQYKYLRDKTKIKESRHYKEEVEDVRLMYAIKLLEMINDRDYKPQNQQELCTNIKYGVGGILRAELIEDWVEIDGFTREEEVNLLDKVAYDHWSKDYNEGYRKIINQLIELLEQADINELLSGGADFQRNLVKLLLDADLWDNNSNRGYKLKTLDYIADKYSGDCGGKTPKNSQISEAKANIRNRLMKCISVVGGESSIDVHDVLPDETERIIQKACKMNQSANSEYCLAYNNLMYKIEETYKALAAKGFELNVEKITDIALFEYENKEYWHFKKIGEKYRIEKYNKTGEKTYSPRRKKRIDFCQPPVCYTVGNCVIFGDVDSKKLYYLTKEYRLFDVIQRDNKYYGFCLSD